MREVQAIKVNKSDLIKAVAKKHGIPVSRTRDIVNDLFELIRNEVAAGNDVCVAGFGRFFLKHKQSHPAWNISAGKKICLPERNIPAFTPADSFKYMEAEHEI